MTSTIASLRRSLFLLCAVSFVAFGPRALAQGNEADFKAAYAAAQAANKKAGDLKNQWTTTAATLAAAQQAAAAGNFDQAVSLSKQAEALANASVAQSEREKILWKDSVLR